MSGKDPRTGAVLGAAFDVHNTLGPGFLEAVYHAALIAEFEARKIPFVHEQEIAIYYKGRRLEAGYRADFICFGNVIIEIKALKELGDVERAQVVNYLKATQFEVALLINFGASSLQYERFANYRDYKRKNSSG
ncbi:MAG: GxxExxY protein [Caldilineaceae bacterium]